MPTEQMEAPVCTELSGTCKNCGADLSGHFCSRCGQPDKELDPSLHDLAHEFVHEFVHLDGKIVATLKALLFRPGRLTAAFLAGRRAKYVGPVRIYLTMSLLFFLVVGHSSGHIKADEQHQIKAANSIEINAELGPEMESSRTGRVIAKGLKSLSTQKDMEVLRHAFLSNVSRVMFVLVPLFAVGLRLAYRNRKRRYPAFVYFSLHYHSFAFLALAIYTAVGFIRAPLLDSIAGYAVLLILPGYLFLALRRAFGGSRRNTLVRMAGLAGFYLPCFGIGLAVAGVVSVLML